jgi:hypothetical protein
LVFGWCCGFLFRGLTLFSRRLSFPFDGRSHRVCLVQTKEVRHLSENWWEIEVGETEHTRNPQRDDRESGTTGAQRTRNGADVGCHLNQPNSAVRSLLYNCCVFGIAKLRGATLGFSPSGVVMW